MAWRPPLSRRCTALIPEKGEMAAIRCHPAHKLLTTMALLSPIVALSTTAKDNHGCGGLFVVDAAYQLFGLGDGRRHRLQNVPSSPLGSPSGHSGGRAHSCAQC